MVDIGLCVRVNLDMWLNLVMNTLVTNLRMLVIMAMGVSFIRSMIVVVGVTVSVLVVVYMPVVVVVYMLMPIGKDR